MDVQEAKRQSREREEWASCDPFTLVSAAKTVVYSQEIQRTPEHLGPLEEVISRFEQQTRAGLGAGLVSGPSRG